MRTNRVFWGAALVVLGGLLLLKSLGIINWNIWLIFWPALLILAGVWLLLGVSGKKEDFKSDQLTIPLQGAQEAVIDINHGAGTLKIGAGANPANLMEGNFAGGVEHRIDYSSQWASLNLSLPSNQVFGLSDLAGSDGFHWEMSFNDRIPLDFRLHTGAGENRVDMRSLLVRKLVLETGASSSNIVLPAKAGSTLVEVRAGVASVVLRVPQGVAGRIHVKSGLVGFKIDNTRFPVKGSVYESEDFDTAENQVEILVEAGVGSIEITSA